MMDGELDPRIVERLRAVRAWYAQQPSGRIDFSSGSYQTEIKSNACFICRLVAGDEDIHSHTIVAENTELIAFLDRYPSFAGHTLVCSKVHVENVFVEYSMEQYLRLQAFVYRVGQAISKVMRPERVYVCSFGSVQEVSHVHFHIIPLPSGIPRDGQQAVAMIRSLIGVQVMNEEEQEGLAAQIRQAME